MVDLTLQGFLSPGARHVAVHVGKQFFEVEQSAIGFAVFIQPVLHPEPSDPIMQQSLNLSIGEIVDFPGDILTNSRIRIRNQLIDGCGIQRVCKSDGRWFKPSRRSSLEAIGVLPVAFSVFISMSI